MNDEQSNYDEILKDIMLWLGIGLALLSIYFSWDGLYKSIPPDKAQVAVAKWVGLLLAVGFTGLQFIFNSDFKKLNTTLFILGLVSYVYSILTNKWGISDLFGFPETISWILAFGMDVAPEAMISWALEDYHKGDMLGNIFSKLGSLRRSGGVKRVKQSYSSNTNRPAAGETALESITQPKMPAFRPHQPQGNPGKHSGGGSKGGSKPRHGKGNFFGE